MSSYYDPSYNYNKNFIFNDERIFLNKINKVPSDKRIYLSASSTVEASIVMPLFIYAVLTFIYLIQIVGLQINMQQALYNECRKMAKYAYACDKIKGEIDKDKIENIGFKDGDNRENSDISELLVNGINMGVAEAMLISELGTDYIKKSHIVGGTAGISLLKSEFMKNDNMIDIVVTYAVKNPFDLFGIGIMTFTQRARSSAWIGDLYNNQESSENAQSEPDAKGVLVYITKNGSVYHTDRNCRYLNVTVHSVPTDQIGLVRNKSGGRYYACEKCESKIVGNELYVTDYGECYHTSKNCSSIVRNILKVPLAEIGGKRKCSKCPGGADE